MRSLCVALFAALIIQMAAMPLQAQDVTLTSRDGKVSVSGTLLSFDGEFFRVETVYGALTLDGTGVTCSGVGCPDLESYVAEFSITGARALGETLLPALIEKYAGVSGYSFRRIIKSDDEYSYELSLSDTQKTIARIAFHLSDTKTGFAAMRKGNADLVLAMREVTDAEAKEARLAGLGDLKRTNRSRIVALDGLVPVVARDNPLNSISIESLIRLFAGETGNWAEIGGPDAPVYLHLPEQGTGLTEAFSTTVMQGQKPLDSVTRHNTAAELSDAVAKDPFAIGITRFSETGNTKILAIRGECGMKSVATMQTIKSEDYPLALPLFIYTPARRLPKTAREFLAFLRSDAAQLVVRQSGFVDQKITAKNVDLQGERLANAILNAGKETSLKDIQGMVDKLRDGKRISITFRFQAGKTALDAQSRANVVLLARLLEAGVFDGQKILFVGFSDGDGDAAINRKIAKRRAATVRNAVREAAATMKDSEISLETLGFGEALPMACDDTEWGKQVNRRVEVWVK